MTGWRQQVMADINPENQEYFQEVLDVKKPQWEDVVKDFYKSRRPPVQRQVQEEASTDGCCC